MPGKHTTLSQIKQILALREVGVTRAVIAAETGVSISTVARICKRFRTRKGRLSARLVEESKQSFISRMSDDQELHAEIAKQMADDIVTGRIIRERLAEAVLKLELNDQDQLTTALRALNSAASALVTVQKSGRLATGADGLSGGGEELPELTIKVMTDEDVANVRNDLLEQQRECGGGALEGESKMLH